MTTIFLFCLSCCLQIVTADFKTTLLACHNEKRAKHGVPPMTLSSDVSRVAQDWADTFANPPFYFQNNQNTDYGQNLMFFFSWGFQPNPDDLARKACKAWYSEVKDYDFKNPGYFHKIGHFTQMVWRTSTQLGGGYSSNGYYTAVVANYNPRGNTIGEFRSNVLEPIE